MKIYRKILILGLLISGTSLADNCNVRFEVGYDAKIAQILRTKGYHPLKDEDDEDLISNASFEFSQVEMQEDFERRGRSGSIVFIQVSFSKQGDGIANDTYKYNSWIQKLNYLRKKAAFALKLPTCEAAHP